LPDRRRTDALDLVVPEGVGFGDHDGENKPAFFNRWHKGQNGSMSAHTAIIAMLKGQVAIAVFPAVLFFLVIVRVMLNQVIGEIAAISVLVRVVIVMRKKLRQLHNFFCK
jgi:hypothetical protein